MKIRSLLILAFLILLVTGCTDRFAGADLDSSAPRQSWEAAAGKSTSKTIADLALRMHADRSAGRYDDSVFVATSIYNEGPDLATGVQVVFYTDIDSLAHFTFSGDGEASTSGHGLVVWNFADGIAPGEVKQLYFAGTTSSSSTITISAEVNASDARDPDSVPGDGDPDQDDFARVTLYPDVPLCPDCPS